MSRLRRNILFNIAGQGALVVLGFISARYIFRQLGEDALGIIYFTFALGTLLGTVLEMGISATLVREVSARWNDEPQYVINLIRTASLVCWLGYGLLVGAVGLAAPALVDRWINLRSMNASTATDVLRVLSFGTLMVLPRSLYTSLFRGAERMEFNNAIDAGTQVLQQAGTLWIIAKGGSVSSVAYWISLTFALGLLAHIAFSARFFSWRALLPGWSGAAVQRNLGFSLQMASITVLSAIHTQSDKVIVSRLLPLGTFGYYGFLWSVVSKSSLLAASVAQAALPRFSALFKEGDRASLLAHYKKLQDLICVAGAPLLAAVPFLLPPIFGYLFTPEVARSLLLPAAFLSLGSYMNGALHVPYVFSISARMPEIAVRSNLLALFVVLPATVALIRTFGLAGAGFSWVFYHVFAYAYAIPRMCRECIGIRAMEWYLHFFKILGLGLGIYGAAWLGLHLTEWNSPAAYGLAYLAASIAFAASSRRVMGPELRTVVDRFLWKPHKERAG